MEKKKMNKYVKMFVIANLLVAAYFGGSKVNVSVVCSNCGESTLIVGDSSDITNAVSTNAVSTNAVSVISTNKIAE